MNRSNALSHSPGFVFGNPYHRVVYLSDITEVGHEKSHQLLDSLVGKIDMLFIDSLFKSRQHPTHLGFTGAKQIISWLKPKVAYTMGMSHDFHTRDMNAAEMREEGIEIQIPFDGMRIPMRWP
jgi:phosphoribosyl 1,2-cyclic phosphodiesterase